MDLHISFWCHRKRIPKKINQKKKRTKISVYSSDYRGVKLSSVSSVPDEYVLRLLRNGEKG